MFNRKKIRQSAQKIVNPFTSFFFKVYLMILYIFLPLAAEHRVEPTSCDDMSKDS